MKITCEQAVIETQVSSVLCDKCGKEMSTYESPMGNGVCINYRAGYDSEHFGDGTLISFDVCEECIFNMVKELKHPPCKSTYLDD